MFNGDTHESVMVLQLTYGGWEARHGQFRLQSNVTKWSFRQHTGDENHTKAESCM